eukprot:1580636-Rhodomonas_salina.1
MPGTDVEALREQEKEAERTRKDGEEEEEGAGRRVRVELGGNGLDRQRLAEVWGGEERAEEMLQISARALGDCD